MNDILRRKTPPDRPPVIRYAIIIGVFAIAAIVVGTILGQKAENPRPSAVSTPMASST